MNPAMNAPIAAGVSSHPTSPLRVAADAGKDAGKDAGQTAAPGEEFSNVFQAAQAKEDLRGGTPNGPRENPPQTQLGPGAVEEPPLAAVPLDLLALAAPLKAANARVVSPSKATVTDTKNDMAAMRPGQKARGEKAHEEKKPKSDAVGATSAAPVLPPTVQLTRNPTLIPPSAAAVPVLGPEPGLPKPSATLAKEQILLKRGGDAVEGRMPLSGEASLAANASPPAFPQQKAEASGPPVEIVPGALKGESTDGKAGNPAPAARPTATSGSSAGSMSGAVAVSDSKPPDPAAAHDALKEGKEGKAAAPNASAAVPPTSSAPSQTPQAATAPGLGQAPSLAAPVHELPASTLRPDALPNSASAAAAISNANPHAILDSGGASSDAARDAAWQFSPNRVEAGFTNAQNSWISVVAARQDGHLTAALQSSSPANGSALQLLLPQLNAHLAERQVQLDQLGVFVRQQFSSGGGAGGGDQGQGQAHPSFPFRQQPSPAPVEVSLSGSVSVAGRISLRA